MPTITTTGVAVDQAQPAGPNQEIDIALAQEPIGRMPAPPPGRRDDGTNTVDTAEGSVKTDTASGRKTLADGRLVHYGKEPKPKKVPLKEGEDVESAVARVVPAGGQLRTVLDDDGELLCYRVIDPNDTQNTFVWPGEKDIEVSGPLAATIKA